MIFYVVTARGAHTMRGSWRHFPRDLQQRIRLILYEALFQIRELPAGTYIFADVERLAPGMAVRAASVRLALERSGAPVRLLNHPLQSMRRFELLKKLRQIGINDFDVHRLAGADNSIRFPVFLRGANDHAGSRTGLIRDPDALAGAAQRLLRSGLAVEEIMVVEFRDSRDEKGVYRKYGAYRAADQFIPTHIYFSDCWMLKTAMDRRFRKNRPPEQVLVAEEIAYLEHFPHRERLREIFALARIDFGRLDYAVIGDRIQVWEINTNPDPNLSHALSPENLRTPRARVVLPRVLEAFFAMFRSLDLPVDPRIRIPIEEMGPVSAP